VNDCLWSRLDRTGMARIGSSADIRFNQITNVCEAHLGHLGRRDRIGRAVADRGSIGCRQLLEDARMRCSGDQEVAWTGPNHICPDCSALPARRFAIVGICYEHFLRIVLRLASSADADNCREIGGGAAIARFGGSITIAAGVAGYLNDVRRAERRTAAAAQHGNQREQISTHGDDMHDLPRRRKARIETVQPVPTSAEVKQDGERAKSTLNLACTTGSALANNAFGKPHSVSTDRRL